MVRRILLLIFLLAVGASITEARVLPRYRSVPSRSSGKAVSGLSVGVKLRSDRQALNVTFANLNKVNSISYTLMYESNGVDQGVSGSLSSSSGNSSSRELLFGTCSSGVCRYHQNITNMKLEVVSELSSGKRTLKRFRIRV